MNDPQQWQQHRAFGALDWAREKHSVIVLNPTGKVIEEFEIEHSALGWKKFREKLQAYGSIPFAIETSQGAAVEQLVEAGMMVYPLNPKSSQAYRDRKAPAGSKTIGWMLGVSPTPYGSMVRVGKHFAPKKP